MIETRICTKCKEELARTIEFFGPRKDSKDGLSGQCRECVSKKMKKHYQENKVYIIAQHKEYCQENKEDVAERHKKYSKNNRDNIAKYQKQYRIDNKEERKIYEEKNKLTIRRNSRIRQEANKEAISEYRIKYRKDNKEHIAEVFKLWYYSNLETNRLSRQRNKESLAERGRIYSKNNPEKIRIRTNSRRARVRKLAHTFTVSQWEEAKLHFDNKCAFCGEERPLTMEHFMAVNNGGEFTKDNIIPSCQSCNSSKNTKDFSTWYLSFRHYSKEREAKILKYLGYYKGVQQLCLV